MKAENVLPQLTLEEAAGLCSGDAWWDTKAVERLGVPKIRMSDGPSGLRYQTDKDDHVGVYASARMGAYPTGSSLASSFDQDLEYEVGKAIAEEAKSVGVGLVLGPAMNLKRTPLCGRNFEYYSEDPYLSGKTAAAMVKGMQENGVGACCKHFACNNQELWRMKINSIVSERALRELYLMGFEIAVKESDPAAIMASYNRVNGAGALQNQHLLKEVLREDWGYQGTVISDWGAVNDRVEALKCTMDLEMPGSGSITDRQLLKACKEGTLDESVIRDSALNVLNLVGKYAQTEEKVPFDHEAHQALMVRAAAESMVLAKNEDKVLPLQEGRSTLFIGEFARIPRYRGGGSASVTPFAMTDTLSAAEGISSLSYVKGFSALEDTYDPDLAKEAVEAAKQAAQVVIFAGLPESYESESFDRPNLDLPACQNRLIQEVLAVNANTAVVVFAGAPVEMPWAKQAKAILLAGVAGQGAGEALKKLLFGELTPCGKTAETYPLKLEDTPAFLNYPGDGDKVEYREDIFVGYRYYDKKKLPVLFPFGHGLSYTEFEISNLRITAKPWDEGYDACFVEAEAEVKNVGKVRGKEVVQLYVGLSEEKKAFSIDQTVNVAVSEEAGHPAFCVKELKGFEKVDLMPGETRTVHFVLNRRSFEYFNEETNRWMIQGGTYVLSAGTSSQDLRCKTEIELQGDPVEREVRYSMSTLMSEIYPEAEKWQLCLDFFAAHSEKLNEIITATDETNIYLKEELKELPLYAIRGLYRVEQEDLDQLIDLLNQMA